MSSRMSPAAAAVPVPVFPLSASPDRVGPLAPLESFDKDGVEGRPALTAIAGSGGGFRRSLRRLRWALGGAGELLLVAYLFPLVVLAVGIPAALLIRLAVWAGSAL
jgi:hypothetical protein